MQKDHSIAGTTIPQPHKKLLVIHNLFVRDKSGDKVEVALEDVSVCNTIVSH